MYLEVSYYSLNLKHCINTYTTSLSNQLFQVTQEYVWSALNIQVLLEIIDTVILKLLFLNTVIILATNHYRAL